MRDFDWKIITTLKRTLSITKTAELLFISQPALTKRLQIIESDLGIQLVERSKKGVEFTPEGEYVAEKATQIIALIAEIHEKSATMQQDDSNVLRIGAPFTFMQYEMPLLMAQCLALFPQIEVEIVSAHSDDLIQYLEDQTIDIGVINFNPDSNYLIYDMVRKDSIFAVYNQPFAVEELNGLSYIDFPKIPATKTIIANWWNEQFTTPLLPKHTVPSEQSAVEMVKNGLGFSIVPNMRYFQSEPNIYSIPLTKADGTYIYRTTWTAYNKSSNKIPLIQKVIPLFKMTSKSFKV